MFRIAFFFGFVLFFTSCTDEFMQDITVDTMGGGVTATSTLTAPPPAAAAADTTLPAQLRATYPTAIWQKDSFSMGRWQIDLHLSTAQVYGGFYHRLGYYSPDTTVTRWRAVVEGNTVTVVETPPSQYSKNPIPGVTPLAYSYLWKAFVVFQGDFTPNAMAPQPVSFFIQSINHWRGFETSESSMLALSGAPRRFVQYNQITQQFAGTLRGWRKNWGRRSGPIRSYPATAYVQVIRY